jgi:enoyl-CoA hydratase
MRLSEALATCPELHLVDQDPAAVEAEWERILRRLEDAGFAVEPAEPGCAYFETRGMERLAGGVRAAVQRALDLPISEGLKVEADLSTLAFQTEDSVEGMAAFIEKRKPVFKDR